MAVANIVCIKWGTLFGPEYVNRLYSGVRRNLDADIRFLCMTENSTGFHPDIEVLELPNEPFLEPMNAALAVANRQGAMRKTSLFKPGLIRDLEGPILGFDLDVVVTGSLNEIWQMPADKIAMRHDWIEARKGRPTGHGSVFRFDPARHGYLYEDLAKNPYAEVEKARGSEQRYTSHKAMDNDDFAYIPNELVLSFKHDCLDLPPMNYLRQPRLPQNARVVCFHGRPKMPEVLAGYRGSLLRWSLACDWLQEHWVERSKKDLGAEFG